MKRKNASCCGPAKKQAYDDGDCVVWITFFLRLPSVVQFKILRECVPFLQKTLTLSRMEELKHLLASAHAWSSPIQAKLNRSVRALKPGVYMESCISSSPETIVVTAEKDTLSFTRWCLEDWLHDICMRPIHHPTTFHTGLTEVESFLKYFNQEYFYLHPDAEMYILGQGEYIIVDRGAGTIRWRDETVSLTTTTTPKVVILPNVCELKVSSNVFQVSKCLRSHRTMYQMDHHARNLCDASVRRVEWNVECAVNWRDFRIMVSTDSAETAQILVEYPYYRTSRNKLLTWGQFFPEMKKRVSECDQFYSNPTDDALV